MPSSVKKKHVLQWNVKATAGFPTVQLWQCRHPSARSAPSVWCLLASNKAYIWASLNHNLFLIGYFHVVGFSLTQLSKGASSKSKLTLLQECKTGFSNKHAPLMSVGEAGAQGGVWKQDPVVQCDFLSDKPVGWSIRAVFLVSSCCSCDGVKLGFSAEECFLTRSCLIKVTWTYLGRVLWLFATPL